MKFPYEVQVPISNDPEFGHQTLEWLASRKKRPDRDFEIDMHGGRLGYTSFWFKDNSLAILVKLTWG